MRTVTIFGGSGFVGRYLVQKFAERGDLIRVAVRNPLAAQFLKPLGEIGQITLVQSSLSNPDQIEKAIRGADVVINLVGILFERGSQTFETIHVEGAQRVAEKASQLGVATFLHMSALGANRDSRSRYASTKAKGEAAVLNYFPEATIFRPSVIFGPEDAFLNRFAQMALISPILPLIGGGKTRFQPVYVNDVAQAFVKAASLKEAQRQIYELGGSSIYTFKALMEFLLITIDRKRILLPLPFALAKLIATFTQWLPSPTLTRDQVELLKTDNVLSSLTLTLEDLGINPQALEVLAPLYLKRYCPGGIIKA